MAKDTKNEQRAEAETTVVGGGLEMAIRQRAYVNRCDCGGRTGERAGRGAIGSCGSGAPGLPRWHSRADVDHQPRADDLCHATRARVMTAAGTTAEWRSALVPRYQRRSE